MKDLLRFNDLLDTESVQVYEAALEFVEREVKPRIDDAFSGGYFPMDLLPLMAEAGYLGIMAGEEYGGLGARSLIYGLVMRALEAGDSGVRSFASVQNSLVVYPISEYGSEEQKVRYLPRLIGGESIGCFGLTEADHGSDPGSMKTRAEKVDGGYLLKGSKMWITNGSIADVYIIWAKLDGVVRGFIVTGGSRGLESRQIKNKWSLRASDTGEIYLDDVFVAEDALLPGTAGLKSALSCLGKARFGIAWGTLGLAESAYDLAETYAQQRIQFGRPIAGFQLQQNKLADLYTRIQHARLATLRVTDLQDSGFGHHAQISLIKRTNAELARYALRTAREIFGAAGISGEYPIMRHMMNMESVYTYEGTHDIHTLILGRYLTGENALE